MTDRPRRILDGDAQPFARDLLSAARSDSPSRRRSAAAVAVALANAAPTAIASVETSPASSSNRRGLSFVVKAAIGVAIASGLVALATYRADAPVVVAAPQAPAEPPASAPAAEPPRAALPAVSVHDLPPASSARPRPSAATLATTPSAQLAAAATDSPDSPDSPDSIDAELAALKKVRSLLRDGEAAQALEELARHKTRWPRGRLVPEAEALTVDAEIAAGNRDRARARAAAFLAKHGDSPLAPRVRRLAETLEHQ